jgi:hypothetical protein
VKQLLEEFASFHYVKVSDVMCLRVEIKVILMYQTLTDGPYWKIKILPES